MTRRPAVSVFLDPLSARESGDRLFGEHPYGAYNAPYRHLKNVLENCGIPVHTGDFLLRGESVGELNVYVTTGLRSRYKSLLQRDDVVLSAFLVQECPVAEPRMFQHLHEASAVFKRMYAFARDDALRPFLREPVSFRGYRYPYPFDRVDEAAWSWRERAFLVMINANKLPRLRTAELYTERVRAIEYFARHGEIDLYGFGWHGPPYRIGRQHVPAIVQRFEYKAETIWDRLRPDPQLVAARRVYKGPVPSKAETLSRYTFAICFENQILDGWVTEKIFDCLVAGAVPVYLGAPDIKRWVAPECFVDMRNFADYDELRAYLHSLSPSEIAAYREAGREYFHSEQYQPFTKQAFADIFREILAEDAGIAV